MCLFLPHSKTTTWYGLTARHLQWEASQMKWVVIAMKFKGRLVWSLCSRITNRSKRCGFWCQPRLSRWVLVHSGSLRSFCHSEPRLSRLPGLRYRLPVGAPLSKPAYYGGGMGFSISSKAILGKINIDLSMLLLLLCLHKLFIIVSG